MKAETLEAYAAHLEANDYAYRTAYLELTTVKQAVAWLVRERHLPADCRIALPLDKPQGPLLETGAGAQQAAGGNFQHP